MDKNKPGLLFISSHRHGVGGGERYLLDLAAGMRPDFRAYLVDAGENEAFSGLVQESGFPLARIRYNLRSAKRAARRLVEVCREWNIDLLHFNGRRDVPLAHLVSAETGLPTVITVHTNYLSRYIGLWENLHGLAMIGLGRLFGRSVRHYIAVTKYAAGRLQHLLGVPPDRVTPIHNGLRVDGLPSNCLPFSDRKIICTVARLQPEKGIEFLLKALARVRVPDWECWIMGDGPDRIRLERLSRDLQLTPHIVFTGTLSRDRVLETLSRSRLMVLPSLYEGLPYALLEAMAMGVPVVVYRVDGLEEAVPEGRNGIMVPPRDIEALGMSIRRLMEDPGLAEQMGREGQRLVSEHFSLDQMISNTRRIYQQLLGT
jgi:glycosyltransferase involved in cell wall biosynthesis